MNNPHPKTPGFLRFFVPGNSLAKVGWRFDSDSTETMPLRDNYLTSLPPPA